MYYEHYLNDKVGNRLHLETISGEVRNQDGQLFNGKTVFFLKDGHGAHMHIPSPDELKRGWLFERVILSN